MKVHHDSKSDYLSIDFIDEVEARSVYQDGIIVRYNDQGSVLGLDIVDSLKLFAESDLMTLREACELLRVSESTMRRRIRTGKISFSMEGKQYRFRKSEILGKR